MANVLHANVALTSALPLQLELKKITLNQGISFQKNINSLNRNVSNEGRQSNRGDYTCSSSSSCNVAGFSLGVVAIVAVSARQGSDASTVPLEKKVAC